MIAEYNSANALQRRYVHGPGTDNPIVWYEGAGTADKRLLHADERGSIVAVSNASGGLLAINTYDEYGIPRSTNVGRFQYTGQTWLPEAGLFYYKARMYSPTLGRFMQTDPIGYADGMNWYAYVGNDPINAVDPSGKQSILRPFIFPAAPPALTGYPSSADQDGNGRNDDAEATTIDLQRKIESVGNVLCSLSYFCSGNSILNNDTAKPLPEGPVGSPDDRKVGKGGQIQSGPLAPENGGTGDPNEDFDTLTGGESSPAPEDSTFPRVQTHSEPEGGGGGERHT